MSVFSLYIHRALSALKKKGVDIDCEEKIFDFEVIEYYFRNASPDYQVNDKTINDIDFYEVFKYLDRTRSKVGQQYFFNQLLTLNTDKNFEEQEIWIDYLYRNPESRLKIENILSKLDKNESYYLSNLFIDEYIKKPRWFQFIRILMFLPVIAFFLTWLVSNNFVFLLIASLAINFVLHYHNKKNIFLYKDSIPQLFLLHRSIVNISTMNIPTRPDESVISSLKTIGKLKGRGSVFEMENKSDSDLFALLFLIIEYFKIIFLLEPLIVFNLLEQLKDKKRDIQRLFEYLGKIDSFVSIACIRENAPYCCLPIVRNILPERLVFKGVYHPLIFNCVPNDLKIEGKSVLLTGSNMAGKTTFIRTVAINVLLAQTINTCFAKEFKLRPMRLLSAIRISDDLFSDKSYFFEEVLSIKDMIDKSSGKENNLFLLDEIFKGTNTIERIAAGKAVLSYLSTFRNNIVFVSTHDVELAEFLKERYDLYHFTEVINDGQIYFDYKLKLGNLSTKNAIRILELNDYPKEVIEEAMKTSDILQHKADSHF